MRLRSHTQRWTARRAITFPLKSVINLTTPEQVEELLCVIKRRNEIALEIEILEVSADAFDRSAFKSIREVLYRTRNITDLVLRFSFQPIRILPTTIVLHRLTSLDVNIAHATVAQLLRTHPHIENLTLGPCNDTLHCPLAGLSLHFLQCLTCPPGCVRALTENSIVYRLIATYDGVRHVRFPILRLLDFRPIETCAVLTTLHIDFDHTAERLFLRISAAAPALVYLKLTESLSSSEVAPMPWDDKESWEAGLRSLLSLKNLLLRSWRPLRETMDTEDALIVDLLRFPERLRHVAVWSGARRGMGRLVVWDDMETGWQNTYEQVSMNAEDPPIDTAAFV
ncbi:hypothetical protein EDB92DRAFT_1956323 [Lactarius akahatsu]|uniref:F-box domain-containing protein n=1 Tax=Lactarius akahatsu TaxID=416441 RepID=A0AAD4Q7K8_9AGAM|nr:hypothetical protein EDB92DRAFT_1956323 [Lactarius akahatsu]